MTSLVQVSQYSDTAMVTGMAEVILLLAACALLYKNIKPICTVKPALLI